MKKNQIMITVLTLMIVAAGYLTYADHNDLLPVSKNQEETKGMEDLVLEENQNYQEDSLVEIDSMDGLKEEVIDDPGEAILTNGTKVSDYLAQVRLNREQTRSYNKETLLSIINDEAIDVAAKQEAIDQMVSITQVNEVESAIETLLEAKGFGNSFVTVQEDSVDVLICKSAISDGERAQIEDVVKRKTDLSAQNIVITLMETQN